MAAIASPTPLSFSSSANEYRQPLRRSIPRSAYSQSHGPRSSAKLVARLLPKSSTGDSSDDDDLAPIKLSAEAQAILGEENSHTRSDKENVNVYIYAQHKLPENRNVRTRGNTPVERLRVSAQANGSPAPRIVRAPAPQRPAALTTVARDGSFMYRTHDKTTHQPVPQTETSHTPPVTRRVIRVSTGRRSSRSPVAEEPTGSGHSETLDEHEAQPEPAHSPTRPDTLAVEDGYPIGPSTNTRPRRGDESGVQSTRLVRRIGAGSMLVKPVRRGMIRRPSEDDELPHYHTEREGSHSPEIEVGRRAREPDLLDIPNLEPSPNRSPRPKSPAWLPERPKSVAASGSTHNHTQGQNSPIQRPISAASGNKAKPTPASNGSHQSARSSASNRKPIFKIPSLPPVTAETDQENEPPPTFKKSKPSAPVLQIHEDDMKPQPQVQQEPQHLAPPNHSPARPPLLSRSNNTPHRPAPAPPPKMSLLDAATSQSTRKKSATHITINSRNYRKLDCIGRGGSSRVYRIMADNFKIFAMKRVNLDDADAAAIAGYKGEIDLLTRLANVPRVIRLFDYEVNDGKGTLTMMMELGESDFNKMLNEQIKGEEAKLDVTFTRHYWKEMLECVQAVHEHGIVHSDLKPANFLLVKGQLKLIDFGIANAIQDNTVNVYRENQIGTPNYMSPESLICQSVNVGPGGEQQKEIKLGRPSDVWSLGCILYQMTYGQPPFAHIQQPMQRVLAIPNPKVEINFPAKGLGGTVVPFGLIKTLRKCLTREISLRPTIQELLNEVDPFLNPVAISPDMLGRVIGNVVSYCRRKEEGMRKSGAIPEEAGSCLPTDEDMKGWPGAFYDKLREAQSEGTAW